MKVWTKIAGEISKPENWLRWTEDAVHVIVILVVAWIITRVVRRLMGQLRGYTMRMVDKRGQGSTTEMERRATTIISVLSKLTNMVIWIFAIIWSFFEFGFRVEPLIAGLGVAGIAVGLGAQTLIKDWLGGLFILLEDQLRIGDGVVINGIGGAVEEINLRTTILRAENGAVHIIANGSITALANMTREYGYYVFEMTIAHGADSDRTLAILSEEGERLGKEEPYKSVMLAPMELMGIERLGDRGALIKARIKTLPGKPALVGRELNRRVKARMDAEKIAFPQVPSLPPPV